MPNSLTPFAFEDALVRIRADEQGNPWFVAKDVCRVLHIEKYRDALATLDEDEKGCPVMVDTPGGPQEMATVSESGLYVLIFRSRKPAARRFRKWVTSEVLPAIRKTGAYRAGASAPLARSPRLTLDSLPEDVLRLKPRVRERCLDFALQSARLADISDMESVHALFVDYCRVMGSGSIPSEASPAQAIMHEFVASCLVPQKGSRLTARAIYQAFAAWWDEQYDTPTPSPRSLGKILSKAYHRGLSNGVFYHNVALAGNAHG